MPSSLQVWLEDGRPYVFPGAGHFLNLDQPDAFDAMISESLAL